MSSPMTTPLQLQAAAGTDPGQVYELNQDNVYATVRTPEPDTTVGLFVVADGMGGHQAGEIASRLAVEAIEKELLWLLEPGDSETTQPSIPRSELTTLIDAPPDQRLQRRLRAAVEQANLSITSYAQENPVEAGSLGTTVTSVLVVDDLAIIANVGDSRTYLARDGQLQQLTQDHSYVAQLVSEGQIAPEDIYTHPRRNVITRSLGHRPDVEVDVSVQDLQPGDRLLLCSDGLWEMIQDSGAILTILCDAEEPKKTVEQLIAAANHNGGVDNIGVVVVHVDAA